MCEQKRRKQSLAKIAGQGEREGERQKDGKRDVNM